MSSNFPSERLDTDRQLWFACVTANSTPHLTPVWFVFVRNRFWVATGTESAKYRNVSSNPMIAISLEDATDPAAWTGRVEMHHDQRPPDVRSAFIAKYDWDIAEERRSGVSGPVVLWEIEPLSRLL